MRRLGAFSAFVVASVSFCLTCSTLAAADPSRPASAWMPYWLATRSLDSVLSSRGLVGVASPFWYDARAASIASYPGASSLPYVRQLRRARIAVVPTLTATSLLPHEMIRLGMSPVARRRHAAMLSALARDHHFDGLDLDYEHLALTRNPRIAARVRVAFTHLVGATCAALHRERRRCVVTVMARQSDRLDVWRTKLIPGVYDYRTLGRLADSVRVMAYAQHAPNTRAGPIAGLPWVERCLRYALRTVPPRKLELGVSLFGYDWGGGRAQPVTYRQAEALSHTHHVRPRWNPRQGAPWFHYRRAGTLRTVWYSNARSAGLMMRLAQRMGVDRIALWAPGDGDPALWRTLRRVAARDSTHL